jgi:hypothetical protein
VALELSVPSVAVELSVPSAALVILPEPSRPFSGIDVANILGERPPMTADVFRGVLSHAEGHVFGRFQDHGTRSLRVGEMLIEVVDMHMRVP